MDDKEYYSLKRITSLSVEQLQKNLKKNHVQDQSQKDCDKNDFSKYRETAMYQGPDDAQMLLEKQNNFDSNI